jgi:hypothetical protein
VDRTIKAAEREADYKRGGLSFGKINVYDRLAASRRKSVRGNGELRGYAFNAKGADKDLQRSRSSARVAGTLTRAERQRLGESFELWVSDLVNEGYDLSDYTWDDMYEIYEETELERKKAEEKRKEERRARIAELSAQGRVMTSTKRTSAKTRERAAQRRQEALERAAQRVLNDTIGKSGRVSEKPMGSEAPKPKQAAPEATRRLATGLKRDTLGVAADKALKSISRREVEVAKKAQEVLKQMRNEEFNEYDLVIEHLVDEGYVENYELAEEMIEHMSDEWIETIISSNR